MRHHDLTGQVFGRLTAVRHARANGRAGWFCTCTCGGSAVVATDRLRSGKTKSCGCKRLDGSIRRTHGMKGTRIYSIWKDMRKRCSNKNAISYKYYGGRNITYCEQWNDFSVFFGDMGLPPSSNHSLDRIDNNGDYTPENCRWATDKMQARNRRNNRIITHKGVSKSLAQWADDIGITYGALHSRIDRYGWSIDRAIETPLNQKPKNVNY